MSVLLVTDDADDDDRFHQTNSTCGGHDYLYQQLKDFPSTCSCSLISSGVVRRRRSRRVQRCWLKSLFSSMLTLLFLSNHLHWPLLFISFSSMKFLSTYASTPALLHPFPDDDQQCVLINRTHIDRLCSRTCRAQRTPFDRLDTINQFLLDIHYLPFCSSYLLNHSINRTNIFDETNEDECREIFTELISLDEQARKASALFTTYMQAIDSGTKENRYSIIEADCQVGLHCCEWSETHR
jgi:hypothetical protein